MAKIEHLLKDAENAYYSHDADQFRSVMNRMVKQMLPVTFVNKEINAVELPDGFSIDQESLFQGVLKIVPVK